MTSTVSGAREMNAVVWARGGARLTEVPVPPDRAGWRRIRVLLAGLCRTDLDAARGAHGVADGRVLGHELVGELEGTRVTVSPMIACGCCGGCAAGERCVRPGMLGLAHDGAFASWVCAPEACVYPVPSTLPLARAAFVEPIAASLAVLRAPIRPADRGLILGRGRIATLTRRILEHYGFTNVDDLAPGEIAREAHYDFVVETSATREVFSAALDAVRPGGVVVLKSRPAEPVALEVTRAVLGDVTLAAVSYGSFNDAIALAATLPIDDLLGPSVPLTRFDEAFTLARLADSPKRFLSIGEG